MFEESFEWTQGRIIQLQDLKYLLDNDDDKTVTVGTLRRQYNTLLGIYKEKQKKTKPYNGNTGRKKKEA